jgi:hypothetical protein
MEDLWTPADAAPAVLLAGVIVIKAIGRNDFIAFAKVWIIRLETVDGQVCILVLVKRPSLLGLVLREVAECCRLAGRIAGLFVVPDATTN